MKKKKKAMKKIKQKIETRSVWRERELILNREARRTSFRGRGHAGLWGGD